MQADERRLAAERADHQCDMLLAAGRVAEGDHLAGRQVVERQLGAGDDGRDRRERRRANFDRIDRDASVSASTSHSAGSSNPASRARVSAPWRSRAFPPEALQRTDRPAVEVAAPGRPAPAPPRVEPVAVAHLDRLAGLGRVALVGEPSAMARCPLISNGARPSGSSRSSIGWVAVSTDRTAPADPTGRPGRRAAIARSIGGTALTPPARGSAAHGRTAVPSRGTARAPGARWPGRELGRGPHMVEPAAAVARRPVLGAIAPPGEVALRARDELAAEIDPVMRRLQPASVSTSIGVWLTTSSSALWFHTSHSSGAMLKSPTIKVGSANFSDQRVIRSMKSSFWPNLGFGCGRECRRRRGYRHSPAGCRSRAGRRRGAPRHCPASRGARVVQRNAAQDGDAMVHLLAVRVRDGRSRANGTARREDMVLRLGLLQAEDVGLLLVEEALDDRRAGADRIDVPGSDLELGHGRSAP